MVQKAKKKKSPNGHGCIRQKKDGRWEARMTVPDPETGKSKVKTFSRNKQKEVVAWMKKMSLDISAGNYVGERKETVADWIITWLNEYAKNSVRQTTWESYESVARCHIIPVIGNVRLQDLRPEQVQRLYNEKLANGSLKKQGGLSATTVRYIHAVLDIAFRRAYKNELIAKNIMEKVDLPPAKKHEIKPLTKEELIKFIEATRGHKYYTAYLLECYTGIRRGELLALRWQDIDFENHTITIKQGLVRTQKGLTFNEPKTERSCRKIDLSEKMISELKIHNARQNQERLAMGAAYCNFDLLFCNSLGSPLDPRNFTKEFQAVLTDAGLPFISFHDMRHTHATLLLAEGENIKVVQERLGHTTVRMTLDTYAHVQPGMQKQATERLERALQL